MDKLKQLELAKEYGTNTNSMDWGFTQIDLNTFVMQIEKDVKQKQLENFVSHLKHGIGKKLHDVKITNGLLDTEWKD